MDLDVHRRMQQALLGIFCFIHVKGSATRGSRGRKSQGGESGDLQRGFSQEPCETVIQPCGAFLPVLPAPNHHRPSRNLLEIHAGLSLVLYSSFNLSFCSKVTQLQGLAPVGYSGAQLKICIAASCCQTRSSRANKNIHLSLIYFHPHSLPEVFITSPWGAPFCTAL